MFTLPSCQSFCTQSSLGLSHENLAEISQGPATCPALREFETLPLAGSPQAIGQPMQRSLTRAKLAPAVLLANPNNPERDDLVKMVFRMYGGR